MSWEKSLTGYRQVETRHGDTLERIALRELGDASRWYDLAHLNGLRPPYLTDDPAAASPRTPLTGTLLMVPASASVPSGVADPASTGATDPAALFGRDIGLSQGWLTAEATGDLAVTTGLANLDQALSHRLETDPGELLYHPDYGCRVRDLLGHGINPALGQLGAAFVDQALRADPRVARTEAARITFGAETLRVSGAAVAGDGKQIPISIGGGN